MNEVEKTVYCVTITKVRLGNYEYGIQNVQYSSFYDLIYLGTDWYKAYSIRDIEKKTSVYTLEVWHNNIKVKELRMYLLSEADKNFIDNSYVDKSPTIGFFKYRKLGDYFFKGGDESIFRVNVYNEIYDYKKELIKKKKKLIEEMKQVEESLK